MIEYSKIYRKHNERIIYAVTAPELKRICKHYAYIMLDKLPTDTSKTSNKPTTSKGSMERVRPNLGVGIINDVLNITDSATRIVVNPNTLKDNRHGGIYSDFDENMEILPYPEIDKGILKRGIEKLRTQTIENRQQMNQNMSNHKN